MASMGETNKQDTKFIRKEASPEEELKEGERIWSKPGKMKLPKN